MSYHINALKNCRQEVEKVMYTVNCDSQSYNVTNSTAEVWNTVDDILSQDGYGGPIVYRQNNTLFATENSYTLYLTGELRNHVDEVIYNAWAEGSEGSGWHFFYD